MIANVEAMEAKIRRRDLLVDDNALFAFYVAKIPADIVTTRQLDDWYKIESQKNTALLLLKEVDVLLKDVGEETVQQFPDHLDCNGNALKLVYSFDPGHEQDGVSLQVPLALLNQITAARLTWLVPGLLADKVQALLRALPKMLRKTLVPLPNTAERLVALLSQTAPAPEETLAQALAKLLLRFYSLKVGEAELDEIALESFYRMNVQVLGEGNAVLAQGRNLAMLQAQFSEQAREIVQAVVQQAGSATFLQRGLRGWTFPELPAVLPQQRGAIQVMAYPALQDDGDSVSITLYDTPEQAEREYRRGLVRLASFALPQQVKYLQKELLRDNRVRLALAALGVGEHAVRDLIDVSIASAFFPEGDLPRSKANFEAVLTARKADWVVLAQQLGKIVEQAALLAQLIQKQVEVLKAADAKITVQDIRSQMVMLWYPSVFVETSASQLLQYARYMDALQKRLERLRGGVPRDRQSVAQLQKYWQAVCEWKQKKSLAEWSEAQQELRWLLEEWRIALFAQPMKTLLSVSEKKVAECFLRAQSSK